MGIKISDVGPGGRTLPAGASGEKREVSEAASAFKTHISNINEQNYLSELQALSERIAEQGKRLSKTADILEMKKLREMVSEYMREALKYSFEFKKESSFDGRGRHRVYAIVEKVDAKLDALTNELLEGQTDSLKIMESIDDIRGLLFDMVA
ncbi:YaaR family protein [Oscillospiraceae bacterium OttesenSCG-928-G22]|nr:YaaR family protein [Oscillospiraceae bacterium OttesenSCG-928-G22]